MSAGGDPKHVEEQKTAQSQTNMGKPLELLETVIEHP